MSLLHASADGTRLLLTGGAWIAAAATAFASQSRFVRRHPDLCPLLIGAAISLTVRRERKISPADVDQLVRFGERLEARRRAAEVTAANGAVHADR